MKTLIKIAIAAVAATLVVFAAAGAVSAGNIHDDGLAGVVHDDG